MRLYDFDAESFTWGSWILDESKPQKAAIESVVLSIGLGFELLQQDLTKVDVLSLPMGPHLHDREVNNVVSNVLS